MRLTDMIRQHQAAGDHDERYRTFNPNKFDYTVKAQLPDGNITIFRNPLEKDGELIDKAHDVPKDTKILAVGTAFWEWKTKLQHTVGIDIDTDHKHKSGLAAEALTQVREAAAKIPWLRILFSSGGQGLHAFPQFSDPIKVATRAEASALARGVLTAMNRATGFDFDAAKDCAGGNLWIYKCDAAPNAYQVLQEAAEEFDSAELPAGWREAKKASKRKVDYAPSTVELEEEHLKMEKEIAAEGFSITWVGDIGCWHIHTMGLQKAYEKHGYSGYFSTNSPGTDPGSPNGYMFPLPGGGCLVKRFGDAREDPSWLGGATGQFAYFNTEIPFERALEHFSQTNSPDGYAFDSEKLQNCLKAAGLEYKCPETLDGRPILAKLKPTEIHLSVEKRDSDPTVDGWVIKSKKWVKSLTRPGPTPAQLKADQIRGSEMVRAVTTDTESASWYIKTFGEWVGTPASEARYVLSTEFKKPSPVMGGMRKSPFILDFKPFAPEYLSGRRWNPKAPQLACSPAEVASDTPTWDAVFEHIGQGLEEGVLNCADCQRLNITSGVHYLQLWTKLLITKPEQRTPYLFLTSRQNNTGKSSFGSSISSLINPGVGEITAEALAGNFSGELEGKVLCLIEELDLRDKRQTAYTKLKKILTSKELTIRRMRTDAYTIPNFTHFIHTANDARFVPCESEDTRIVMVDVLPITEFIETSEFDQGIAREAPSMLRKLLDLLLPEPCGRFWLPVVHTSLKEDVVAGIYDDNSSEEIEGVLEFAKAHLSKTAGVTAPVPNVLTAYRKFCGPKNPGEDARFETVHFNGFLKVLRDRWHPQIGKIQKRSKRQRVWHYTGVKLKK